MTPPPIPQEAPSRLEVALTAFVFPGAGQLVQQRWIVAGCFLILSLGLVVALIVVGILPQFRNLGIALGMWGYTGNEPFSVTSIPAILSTAAALLLVHLVSIIDAAVAYRRRRARWLHARRG